MSGSLRRVSSAATYAICGLRGRSYHSLPELKYPAELPVLPYDYKKGVEPVFSPRQMELHYTKHHKAYVDKLNSIGKGLEGKTIESIIRDVNGVADKKVMFNQAAQHFNHTFYWKCITPGGQAMPAELEKAIAAHFGSVEAFKTAFQQAGVNNFGSGWTWLCVNPSNKTLEIDNTSNAGCPITSSLRPILTADVWEHAYYKDFENRRPDYLSEYWKVVNWQYVHQEYLKAMK